MTFKIDELYVNVAEPIDQSMFTLGEKNRKYFMFRLLIKCHSSLVYVFVYVASAELSSRHKLFADLLSMYINAQENIDRFDC